MRILVSGLGGAMGREVAKLALAGYRGAELVGGVSLFPCDDINVPCTKTFEGAVTDADCVVDFSHHCVTADLLRFVTEHKLPLVLATTGQTEEEKAAIYAAAEEIPLFFCANYSLGVALLIELAKKTAAMLPDAEIEIIEKHHDRKIDAPSGTALAIADAIREVRPEATVLTGRSGQGKRTPNEIGIHAIRMGNIVGEHEVMIGTNNQTITLKHEAHSRALFAEGALAAAAFLQGKSAGLYDMKRMITL
ncbi:MAG: 4-hydroxy-tetrahydrodipicolinate reductase [Oscillospiraceae bacterium]|nr:4-hydroxy-tetrahydrodipicolinate reductase [Oscillospiraceae bacterium]